MSLTRHEFIYTGASSLFALGLVGWKQQQHPRLLWYTEGRAKEVRREAARKYEVTIGTHTDYWLQRESVGAKSRLTSQNNSDETAAFMRLVRVEAYQDGQQLESAISDGVTGKAVRTKTRLASLMSSKAMFVRCLCRGISALGKDKLAAQTFTSVKSLLFILSSRWMDIVHPIWISNNFLSSGFLYEGQ